MPSKKLDSEELGEALQEYFSSILSHDELLNSMLIKVFMAEHVRRDLGRTSARASLRDLSFREGSSLGKRLDFTLLKKKRRNNIEEEDEEEY